MVWRSFLLIGTFAGLVVAGSGCSSPTTQPIPESSRNLRSIGEAYKKASEKLGRAPANRQEIELHLKEWGNPDEIMRSPDDGENYVVVWGTNAFAYPATVLAYEATGKGGRRFVLWGAKVWSMSDEEFKKAPFAPGHKAPI